MLQKVAEVCDSKLLIEILPFAPVVTWAISF